MVAGKALLFPPTGLPIIAKPERYANMAFWKSIIDIGHTELMFPMAAAVAAWLVAGRAWKLALCWCLMFVAGTAVVALSKIAFLGWGTGIPALGFHALSGHALCASAVLPVFFFVVLQNAGAAWRAVGAGAGIGASIGIGALMVYFGYHTVSEVVGSFALGVMISLGYMRCSSLLPPQRISRWTVLTSLLTFLLIFSLDPSRINHRLVDVALHLSGRDHVSTWPKKLMCKARAPVSG